MSYTDDLLGEINLKLDHTVKYLAKIAEILENTLRVREAESVYEVWVKVPDIPVGRYNSYQQARSVLYHLGEKTHFIKILKKETDGK